MLLGLMFSLLAGVIVLVIIRHDKGSVLLSFLVASMFVFVLSMLIYIAKKGGINTRVSFLLFGPSCVRETMQYLSMTLGVQSFLVAAGRYTAPLFFLWTAFCYNEDISLINVKKYAGWFCLLPIFFLVISIPVVFERYFARTVVLLKAVYFFSFFWIIFYVLFSLGVLVMEYRNITIRWFKKQFLQKSLLIFGLCIIYFVFCSQDPAQVLLFYRNAFMQSKHVWYLSKGFNAPLFLIICLFMIFCEIVSFITLLRYTQLSWDEEKEEATLKKKAHDVAASVNIIVHGIKNDLLVNTIIIKRLERYLVVLPADTNKIELLVSQLKKSNDGMAKRMEQLYSSMQNQSLCFRLVPLQSVLDDAVVSFHMKYPDGPVVQKKKTDFCVLCDRSYLCEAFANLLLNGWEASYCREFPEPVEIQVQEERKWTAVHIIDKGKGIPASIRSKLYEPFVSSKNSATNWGMGMYYVRSIIRDHMGLIHFETGPAGTVFYVLLPKIRRKANE